MRKTTLFAAVAAVVLLAGGAAVAGPEFGDAGLDLPSMDRSVAPGDDFNAFMNGGWLKTVQIPADRSSWGDVARLREQSAARVRGIAEAAAKAPASADQKKFGDLYASFMDEQTIEAKGVAPLKADLASIAAIKTKADLARTMAALERRQPPFGYGSPQPSFPVYPSVGIDAKDPTKASSELLQGGLGLPDRDYYLVDDPKFVAARAAYRNYLVTLFKLAGISDGEARADRVIAFETELAKAHWNRIDSRDQDKIYNPTSPAKLAADAPGFDWASYLQGAGFGARPTLIVNQPSAMAGFAKLAAVTPMQTWQDYLTAHVISNAAPVLPKAFVDADFEFHGKALSGTPELAVRWKRGVGQVNLGMGDAVGKVYAAQYFPPAAKAKIEAMVAEIKAAMAKRIDGLDWMAPQTKVRAKAKLANLKIEVGTPDKWYDYSKLSIVRGDAFGNAQRAAAFEYDRNLATLDQPVDRAQWWLTLTPQTVNAFNAGSLIKLAFPAGYLAPPAFDPDADPAVNYGAIGTVIGHEISHSFDDQGAKLDEKGRLIDWWTPADVKAFEAATGKLAAQYDAYEPLPGVHLKGRLQLGENVGDLGGLAAALEAYHASLGGKPAPVIDGLTGDQRFFLAYAQAHRSTYREAFLRQLVATNEHSPDQYRTYNVRNIDAWYDAFDVKPGQKLYLAPADRVRIW
ncbi:MAG TPA: M13-type metalloendopeptidase [Phenylobacterium sp.]|jgi:putative endopeptidase